MRTALMTFAILAGCTLGSALSPSVTALLDAQQLGRYAANPNNYVICEGRITGNQCSGTSYSAGLASGIFAAASYDEIKSMNSRLATLDQSTMSVRSSVDAVKQSVDGLTDLLRRQIAAFNLDLQRSVAKQLDSMPATVVNSQPMAEFKNRLENELKDQLMREVDTRIAAATMRPPRPSR